SCLFFCVLCYPEVKVFKIVIIGLALFILTVTGLYCISICYSRNRSAPRSYFI
ncbi:hypothetical protein GOODEAATRI_020234, partial [Goodea atripinnis]